jgi:hypothetical protein
MPLFSGEHYLLAASTDARPPHRLLDESRLATYAVLVRSAVSESARQALEDLMTTKFRDTFVDRLLAEGEAKG